MVAAAVPQASTREAFGKALVELGKADPNVVVLGADLNKSVMTIYFAKEFPDRFFDVGAQEQNMMSIAAGLAAAGKVPFASTFAVFASSRAFDQIRISIGQNNANVKIVVTHAGVTVGEDGSSAQAIEDLALLCSVPGMNVIVPADAVETTQAVRVAAETRGPFYIRLSRPATPVICGSDYRFALGKASLMREGRDVTIIAMGTPVAHALEAASRLATQGVQCRVLNMATLKPLDEAAVLKAAQETSAIVTVEEHLEHGGLGSAVARVVVKRQPVPMEMVALPDVYGESGKPEELFDKYGLSTPHIEKAVRAVQARKGKN